MAAAPYTPVSLSQAKQRVVMQSARPLAASGLSGSFTPATASSGSTMLKPVDDRVTIFTRPDGEGGSSCSTSRREAVRKQLPATSATQRAYAPASEHAAAQGYQSRTPAKLTADNLTGRESEYRRSSGKTRERRWSGHKDPEADSGSDQTLEPDEVCVSHGSRTPSPHRSAALRSGAAARHCEQTAFVSTSRSEARAHCEASTQQESTQSDIQQPREGVVNESISVIACNERGDPVLYIKKDVSTGRQRTVVRNADGSERVFGNETVQSMVENTEDALLSWLESLNVTELKGLLNEVTHHVAEGSREYHQFKAAVESLNSKASYSFFGLSEDACEKELDNAYRNLARRMHPDKNGGTEAAKEKFQNMKDRYEALKRHRAEAQGRGKENQENQESCDIEAPSCEAEPKPASDEAGKAKGAKQACSLPELLTATDRGILDEAARQMMTTLRSIRSNMAILKAEQDKLASQLLSQRS